MLTANLPPTEPINKVAGAKRNLNDLRSPLDDNKSNLTNLTATSAYSRQPQPIERLIFFVTFSSWMTFAALLLFQANLLHHIEHNWPNNDIPTTQKEIFEHGVSATFFGTLLFRIGHEIFWSAFSSKTRVVISLCCLTCSMTLLFLIYFVFSIKQTWWIILINFLGGIGIGAIEPNILTSILVFGDATKVWALYGISVGFNAMSIFGFYLLSINIPLYSLYLTCGISCIISIFFYLNIMKRTPSFTVMNSSLDIIIHSNLLNYGIRNYNTENYKTSTMRLRELKHAFHEYKKWLFILLPYGVFLTIDLFSLNFFCTVSLYVFYKGKLPLFSNLWIDRNLLFAISGILNVICQMIGMRTSFYSKYVLKIAQNYPIFFVLFQLICGVLCCCVYFIQPFVVLLGIAGVYLMNGTIYSSGVKYIDTKIDKKYNLISLSVWLIFADIGSIIGQNTFEPIVNYVCNNTHQSYYCDNN